MAKEIEGGGRTCGEAKLFLGEGGRLDNHKKLGTRGTPVKNDASADILGRRSKRSIIDKKGRRNGLQRNVVD